MRFLRYFAVGGTAAAVDISIFVAFAKSLGFPHLAVAAIGFTIATFVNYALSIRFVFESGVRFDRSRELMMVYAVSGVGLAINHAVLYLGIDILSFEMVTCKLIASATVFLWNYAIRARYVFQPRATP